MSTGSSGERADTSGVGGESLAVVVEWELSEAAIVMVSSLLGFFYEGQVIVLFVFEKGRHIHGGGVGVWQ